MVRTNYLQLALDLRRGIWLIKDPDIWMPDVNAFFSRERNAPVLEEYQTESYELTRTEQVDRAGKDSDKKKVMVIPLHGVMTKYDTCESYGTTTIAAKMEKYIGDKNIAGFVLDIDSPGGSVNAIAPLTAAVAKAKSAGHPVIAHCDSCFSAAYWVASQCDAIFADNDLSGFGSIGAYAQILDDREDKQTGFKVITIYAPESTEKNAAYRNALEGKPEKMQQELSAVVTRFQNAVKAGRPGLKTDTEGILSGADFLADAAIAAALADGYASLAESIENVFIRNEYN